MRDDRTTGPGRGARRGDLLVPDDPPVWCPYSLTVRSPTTGRYCEGPPVRRTGCAGSNPTPFQLTCVRPSRRPAGCRCHWPKKTPIYFAELGTASPLLYRSLWSDQLHQGSLKNSQLRVPPRTHGFANHLEKAPMQQGHLTMRGGCGSEPEGPG